MKFPIPETQQVIERILKDLDFSKLYSEYDWQGDTHVKGFPYMFHLEKEISDAARKNSILLLHLVEIAKWGKHRNTKNISCPDPLNLILYVNNHPAPELAAEAVTVISKIDAQVRGFGPTYSSKLLHFAVPQIFGALDTRLVRIFGNSAPDYHLLNLDAEKSGDRWLIPPTQPGWPSEYRTWIAILNYVADKLNHDGKTCPHPRIYYENDLREEGIWLPADVETALFSYASQQIFPSSSELEQLIGYTFHNKKILSEATTRRAFLNENPSQEEECMDPLATLGDAVLDAVAVYRLYGNGKRTKGALTECKSLQVKRKRTRAFAEQHHLHKYIQWGKGELKQKNWTTGDKALDTVTEALIGAVYLDAQKRGMNGMKVMNDLLERMGFFLIEEC